MRGETNEFLGRLFGCGIYCEDGIIPDLGVDPFRLEGMRREGKERGVRREDAGEGGFRVGRKMPISRWIVSGNGM